MTLPVATNPETGETLVYTGSAWQKPERIADNEKGERAYLVGGAWVGDFASTPGGAATGNPSIQRQGERAGMERNLDPLVKIGGATGIGGALGAVAGDLMVGAGRGLGSLPYPFARRGGLALESMGQATRAAGRPTAAAAGAISGATGETAGQVAELAGAGPITAELARLAGGFGPEIAKIVPMAVKHKAGVPWILDQIKLLQGKEIKLSEREQALLEGELAKLRGGDASVDPYETTYTGLQRSTGEEVSGATRQAGAAQAGLQAAQGMKIGGIPSRPLGETGATLRDSINKIHGTALEARSKQFTENAKARDLMVDQRVAAGQPITGTPEHAAIVAELKAELTPGKHSADVAAGYQKILDDLTAPRAKPAKTYAWDEAQPAAEGAPPSFLAIDEVRRNLGEVFRPRGAPPEGYKAIDAKIARDYYAKISELQKSYLGGEQGIQAKLLDDYARDTAGLAIFRAKSAKPATAVDRYNPDEFLNDASTLPKKYFKSADTVSDLIKLTGDRVQVNKAALEYANTELAGANSKQATKWLSDNSEWLGALPMVRKAISNHADTLASAERNAAIAERISSEAASRQKNLMGTSGSVARVKEIIESGNRDLWSEVGRHAADPKVRAALGDSVRQAMADMAEKSPKTTAQFFDEKVRDFLTGTRLMKHGEAANISGILHKVAAMDLPPEQILGWQRRIILQAVGGAAAAAPTRAGMATIDFLKDSREREVPQ